MVQDTNFKLWVGECLYVWGSVMRFSFVVGATLLLSACSVTEGTTFDWDHGRQNLMSGACSPAPEITYDLNGQITSISYPPVDTSCQAAPVLVGAPLEYDNFFKALARLFGLADDPYSFVSRQSQSYEEDYQIGKPDQLSLIKNFGDEVDRTSWFLSPSIRLSF